MSRKITKSDLSRADIRLLLNSEEAKNYLQHLCRGGTNVKWITKEIQEKQGIDEKIGKLYKAYKSRHDLFYN